MTDTIIKAGDAVHKLTSSEGVQAMIAVIVTLTLMGMLIMQIPIPDEIRYAWFLLIGLYMPLPGKSSAID